MHPTASLSGLTVSLDTNDFRIGDAKVHVTPQQADLLHILTAAYPRTVPYDVIITRLWGLNEPGEPLNGVKVVACSLRKKLKPHGFTLTGVVGRGMRIDGPEAQQHAA